MAAPVITREELEAIPTFSYRVVRGAEFRAWRKRHNLQYVDVAELFGCTTDDVNRMNCGRSFRVPNGYEFGLMEILDRRKAA